MKRLGVGFRQQVFIDAIGRVDFLIGDSLVVELDSFEHHQASRHGFNRDRERDADLQLRGYRVIRLTYDQVFYRWEECEARVREAIRKGFHRKRVR
ncbi:endonuclease domain-containing protein [Dermabacter hominis]|uniref:endonuclease domain-containing protein n=1 Tax=Dermabacter hominis TaxID=36740 RepID=UPI003C6C452B